MKKKGVFIALLYVASSLLTGCEEKGQDGTEPTTLEDTEEADNSERYTLKHAKETKVTIANQEFEIIPVLEPIFNYVQIIEQEPLKSKTEAYTSTVIEPFRKTVYGEENGHFLQGHLSFQPPRNVDKLKASVQKLDENYEDILDSLKTSLKQSVHLLPLDSTTKIYVFPFNPDQLSVIDDMNGVTGFATPNTIVLNIEPEQYTEEMLRYIIAHEYHHIVHFNINPRKEQDLMGYSLMEGGADSFAQMIYPDVIPKWNDTLTSDEWDTVWNLVLDKRYDYDRQDIEEIRNGNNELPMRSHYKLGYRIMQDFIKKNPSVSVEEWTMMMPDEILEKTSYADKVK
ncbi:DUF2268 domain-containing protein [Pontibacillus salipaludis]|uniref:DUF2268 domain-containing protein n=1 Tax=Pontibacillus salipaludis TaxID=1697394 RepID=A0ABQ1Q207_9BACI|nr:DUF2268 domain-containing putative Zn-dependent protease [Pontibacillus salipaludis]GGD09750.1 hypothetical protein GCM10011389_16550 [Pontibacillus salipaludis]